MSINKKDRCLFGNKEEQLRIYNQRKTINRLEQENKQLKERISLLEENRDEAVEYIKDNEERYNTGWCFSDGTSSTELLEILGEHTGRQEEHFEQPTQWDLDFEKGFKGSNEY